MKILNHMFVCMRELMEHIRLFMLKSGGNLRNGERMATQYTRHYISHTDIWTDVIKS